MKVPSLLALAVFLTCLFTLAARAEDEFTPITVDLSDRAAVMKLPDGVRRIRLRVRHEDGTWKTCTIAHLEGSEGYLKLRLPDDIAEEDLEVTASWTDPFPYSFYQGASTHPGTESADQIRASPFFGPQVTEDNTDNPDAEPAVEESDIWKWRDSTLYFFNQYRGLQVIDVTDPAAPDRLASLRVDSYGEQMYLHPEEDVVILLTYDASTGNGAVVLVAHELTHVLQQQASIPVPGSILESRLVGNVLYVVSRNSWQERNTTPDGTLHVVWRSGLAVTKIDLNDPAKPVASPPLLLGDGRYNYWGAQVQATSRALLVSTNAYDSNRRQSLSTVHVIDISDQAAPPVVTHHLPVAGQILNKFNLNLSGNTLTAVSQVWRGTTTRQRYASVETFDLSRPNPTLASIEFANNESITASRFVGDLLYVVTFLRVDPLFVINLADPAHPKLLSELEIPGFSTYLQPLGEDALISIGIEGSQIAVSWFDVSDPTATSLRSRVFIGAEDGWSWTEANWDEKAFGFFPEDNLLLVPYQGSVPGEGWVSGVQLVELGDGKLTKRGSFAHEFQARRARVLGDVVVSISGRALKSLDVSDPDHPQLLAELTLAWPADLVYRLGDVLVQLERGPSYFYYGPTETPARLHVSPVDDPDELLNSLDLPAGRIAGSFLQGDCLFIAQSRSTQVQVDDHVETTEIFTTSVVDLSDPTQPVLTGEDSFSTTSENFRYGFGADYLGGLLPDGSLVWYPAEQQFYYAWDILPLSPMEGLGGDVIFPFYRSSARVFTVDLSDKARPVILAAAELSAPDQSWPEGEITLVGSTLYHGLQITEHIVDPDGSSKWFSHHMLGTLDLGDPAAPVPGDLVTLPGTFKNALSTPAGGTILFTSTRPSYRDLLNVWHSDFRVQALAFDGLSAFLLDELVVPDRNYGPELFSERFIVLGEADYSGDVVVTNLTIYEWSNSGSFREVQSLERSSSIYALGVLDHLLVARGSELSFIDFSDPAEPDPASISFPATRFWQGVDKIAIHERETAYLPLGFYGVQSLSFGGLFQTIPPGSPPNPGQAPSTEWQRVPLATLMITSPTDGLLLGPLAAGSDWSSYHRIEPIEYRPWTQARLGLSPDDLVPAPTEDLDGDGKDNFWEYCTGTDPSDPGDVAHLELYLDPIDDGARHLHAYLPLNPHAAASLRVDVARSANLSHWEPSHEGWTARTDSFRPGVVLRLDTSIKETPSAFLRVELSSPLSPAP